MSQKMSLTRQIAIVGMAGRFPGARDVNEFWQNLRNGVESIARIDDEEWGRALDMHPAFLVSPSLVRARPKLEGVDMFDAAFFGFTPRAAQILDPQQRIFLECAWEALENAGYDSERFAGSVGVYAGVTPSTYLMNLLQHSPAVAKVGWLDADLSNRCDSLATRVGYKLNLQGPCFTVQSYCSTSLVAIHLACQNLLSGECDMAIAGGVTITVPQETGYYYLEGSILSPDGHTRTFDAKANGMVFGNGAGVVVLRRLSDALDAGDTIWAVIRGSATNNDGSLKAGFTAPSVSGQSRVIADALRAADVHPDRVSYVEAHGTATPLGDPAEIAALTKAYRQWTDRRGYCAIGSAKTNVGHLDAAAGVTGVIKTAMSLTYREIPASLHFETPNPQIDFESSPFYVNTALREWTASNGDARCAGVSAYGIGGTNAHMILEEAPALPPTDQARPWQLLTLSARTATALDKATSNLREDLEAHADRNVADVAFTLQTGRRAFDYRRVIVCRDRDDALSALADARRQESVRVDRRVPPIAFMFTGQGAQYVNMGRGLYDTEPVFRIAVDDCCARLQPRLGFNLLDALYPPDHETEDAADRLRQTSLTQPALFVIEYALARLWQSWGVHATAMIGHSIGEYVAAHLAGVFSLDDALTVVAERGRLMQSMPPGGMLAVQAPESEVVSLLSDRVCLAAVNAPSACVLAGPDDAIAPIEATLTERGVVCRRLQTSHAFHSSSMNPILPEFRRLLERMTLNPPTTRFISNVTGTWITDDQATSPDYWAQHLRQAVRFSQGVRLLADQVGSVLIEVGPGGTLAGLARQHVDPAKPCTVVNTLRHPKDELHDRQVVLGAVGRVWMSGAQVDFNGLHSGAVRRRIPLPTYPFERQQYWVKPDEQFTQAVAIARGSSTKREELSRWFYQMSWRRYMPVDLNADQAPEAATSWVVFADDHGIGLNIAKRLKSSGRKVVTVTAGRNSNGETSGDFVIDPQRPDDYLTLVRSLVARQASPTHIVHLWGVSDEAEGPSLDLIDATLDRGFYSLLFLAQALGREDIKHEIRLAVVTSSMREVIGGELTRPDKATVMGPCRVIPQEFKNITTMNLDIEIPSSPSRVDEAGRRLIAELLLETPDRCVAYRGRHRWVETLEPTPIGSVNGLPIREGGTYLITGGQGGIGLALAEYLAKEHKAKLVLTARTALPSRSDWPQWLDAHGAEDSVSRRIAQIQRLEEHGAEVLSVQADVADLAGMRQAVAAAHERFGPIQGVVHAAGIAGGGVIQMKQRDVAARVLEPKVRGTLVLAEAVKDDPVDFLVLCSSTAAVIGGFGQVDYCGANAFLDAFAHRQGDRPGPMTIAINWDAWKEVGMAVNTAVTGALRAAREISLKLGITNAEGIEAFKRVLSRGLTQVLVVPMDLKPALGRMVRPKKKTDDEREADAVPAAAQTAAPQETGERPAANDLERVIRDIWNEVLGRRPGVDDNFFELGGDSMTAIQVTALMKARLGRDLALVKLYEAPTVGLLARALDTEKSADSTAAMEGVERRAETRLELMHRRRRGRSAQPILETAS